jgi:hypothetical protein
VTSHAEAPGGGLWSGSAHLPGRCCRGPPIQGRAPKMESGLEVTSMEVQAIFLKVSWPFQARSRAAALRTAATGSTDTSSMTGLYTLTGPGYCWRRAGPSRRRGRPTGTAKAVGWGTSWERETTGLSRVRDDGMERCWAGVLLLTVRRVSRPLELHTLARDGPANLSHSYSESHQHWPPADANCCQSLLLDPDATMSIDLHKRLFLLVTGRGE